MSKRVVVLTDSEYAVLRLLGRLGGTVRSGFGDSGSRERLLEEGFVRVAAGQDVMTESGSQFLDLAKKDGPSWMAALDDGPR